ncbi:branched-chain amino acid transporter [Lampropedia cohaerens]|uniref:Branched-chain amino acid transporter n=1 Tax=Lampropedia cohaerens TaxID=1610491 RepID=A0A0U1PWV7_9BURK|nr:AzlD domain-containing protein [Lampropedia cohaerens]KKW66961.1 branched-chain amino acid transporter [Lampropedia cohaerens]
MNILPHILDSEQARLWLAIAGLTVVTILTRAFFMIPRRELPMPQWLRRGLRYAPLAALAAVIVPELMATETGTLALSWQDARLWAAPAACGYYYWRRGIMGTIVAGMLVYLPLRLLLGW